MSGKLFVTGTPIGNLGDITYRQAQTLADCDFIAAEDTRVTLKLLNYLEIKKPMISFHEHSAKPVLGEILDRIENGENCCIVTDAGMPCISDPGEPLVRACRKMGIEVVAVPGPTAFATAVAISGQDTKRFIFEGFLPATGTQRKERLLENKDEKRTMVYYEAPHRLIKTLNDMAEVFGKERNISICREITKLHEEVKVTTFEEALEFYKNTNPKGEFVLVISGKPDEVKKYSLEEAVELVKERVDSGIRLKIAAKEAALLTGFKKSELYDIVVKSKNEQ